MHGGAAVVHGNTVYFSQGYNVYAYSYTLSQEKWSKLKRCEHQQFSMAVVNNKLTTIGGQHSDTVTKILLCLSRSSKWEKLLPPMPTARIWSAAVTTPTHLIVAGGETRLGGVALSAVDALDTNTLHWSSVSSSPKAFEYPNMTLCNGQLYLSEHSEIFSCSVEELLRCRKPASSVWNRPANIPVPYWASLTTLRGQVLAIGGRDQQSMSRGCPTEAIHCYSKTTNSWSVIGGMPTPRTWPIVAVLPSHELIVVGGFGSAVTEVATSTY